MKRRSIVFTALISMVIISACAKEETPLEPTFKLIQASDLHYIANELTDHGERFTSLINQGDGKLTAYCDELTDAFFAEVIKQKPDALVLSGDLSFNGAIQSHLELAEKLKEVEKAGINVLVLSGNHDVYNHNAASFSKDGYTLLQGAESEDFRQIYADFGFDEAIASDSESLSYVAQLNDTTRILMLDTNSEEMPCGIAESSMHWVEEQLKDAKAASQYVIAVTHQNLMQHTMFKTGYVIKGADELIKMFEKYGVELSLCGHMHIQHSLSDGKLTEIAVSSLAVTPNQVAYIAAEKGKLTYQTQQVDVAGWAKEQGLEDENLLNFASYANDFMDTMTIRQFKPQLADDFTLEQQQQMIDYACRANRAYFSGNMSEFLNPDDEETFKLWETSNTMSGNYMASMADDFGKNHTIWHNNK